MSIYVKFFFIYHWKSLNKTSIQKFQSHVPSQRTLTRKDNIRKRHNTGLLSEPHTLRPFILNLLHKPSDSADLKGLEIGERKLIVGLFADSLIVCLGHPDEGSSLMFNLLETFGDYSVYKVTTAKTQVITFNFTHLSKLKICTALIGTVEPLNISSHDNQETC